MDGTLEDHAGAPPATEMVGTMSEAPTSDTTLQTPNPRLPPSRQVSTIDAPKVKTGVLGSSSNLVNTIVGAGIIGIPYAISTSGLIGGVVLLIVVGFFTDKSLRMIVELASFHPRLHELGVLTFEDLMTIPFGRIGRNFVLITMFIMAYGAMVAYLLIIKDNVPTVLGLGHSFVERELVMLATSLGIMLPLSMLRDISQLSFTSCLSVLADVVLIIIVCAYAPITESVQNAGGFGQVLADNWINGKIFIGLGILSTAMACQHSSFLIANTLENRTSRRWGQVTMISVGIATILCLVLGLVGYLGYLEATEGDVLNNFPAGTPVVNVARGLLAITMFFTYPMESFVARHVVIQFIFRGNMDNTTVGPDGQVLPEQKFLGCLGRREKWTIYLYCMTLLPALVVDDLGPVLSLTGSLGASSIAYIAPGLVYLGVNGDAFLKWAGKCCQSKKPAEATTQAELPVAGDAGATMQTASEPPIDGRKPWWWWLVGMPIWVAIASSGSHGTKKFLQELGEDVTLTEVTLDTSVDPASMGLDESVIGPRRRDFLYSIVFIVFGVIAAVFGVISNVYVAVNQSFIHE